MAFATICDNAVTPWLFRVEKGHLKRKTGRHFIPSATKFKFNIPFFFLCRFSSFRQRGAVALTASADVQSANIVGYQNVTVPFNKSLITPTFKKIGAKLDLTDIRPLNDEGVDFVKGMKTACSGKISIQKITSSSGKYASVYAWYWPKTTDGKEGWCDAAGNAIKAGDVPLADGEAILVSNQWKADTAVNFRCSGEVDLLGENAIPYNKALSGNALPRSIDLTEITVLNDEKQPFIKGMKTACSGKVSIQKLTASSGKYGAVYAWYWPKTTDGKEGWCDAAGKAVAVGDVVFDPGEAMLVSNQWKQDTIVYFDLPDPLTPMPVPEEK